MYIFTVIKKSILLFNKKQRVSFALLLLFFLFSALIQVIGIASIGPFIALLSNAESVTTNPYLSYFYHKFSFTSTNNFVVAIGLLSLFMMVFSNCISVLTLWLLMRFSIIIGGDIQRRLFENFIFRPYIFHKANNYAESISIIMQEAPRFVYMVIQPILLLLSNLFVALVILAGLVYLNPTIVFITSFVLSTTYLFTYIFLKKNLKKHGEVITYRNSLTQKILTEAFIGIKEVILNQLQNNFANNFKSVNMKGLKSTSFITLSGDIPKFVVEMVAFSVIFITAIIAILQNHTPQSIVPLLSIFALAGYKLLPTMQQIYKSVSTLSAHGSAASAIFSELQNVNHISIVPNPVKLESVKTITLSNISFKYQAAKKMTLENVNVTFQHNMINTIAGHSGSGKSTLVDILLNLLTPDTGEILIDGRSVDKELAIQLQCSSGYVPQQIFILDGSVLENVAFGINKDNIDESEVIRALKLANAWSFVESLPQSINTRLGLDGKLLSGGQRQKIGIARSLYRNPKILILDEPTSALDIESEYDFMVLLRNLKEKVLIIIISHRPSALKFSDLITLLNDGKVEAHGTMQQLKELSPHFNSMLEKSTLKY